MAAPLDPAVLAHLRPARRPLGVGLGAGVVGGLATVAQAFAVGTLIVELVSHPTSGTWHASAWWLLGLTLLRVCAGWVVDTRAARAAGQVSTAMREQLLAAAADAPVERRDQRTTGDLTLLATRGLAAIEPYLTRYLPTLVLAAVLPAATVLAIFYLDWISGLIVAATLPLVPVFAILIGHATQAKADRQWRQLSALSGHFLDVVRGLGTLVTFRRARAQSDTIATITDRYRRASIDTLRTAFASSAALELIATLSVALVAVSVGLRLAADSLDFRTALIVLLLAPEAYWPLRRVGAEFHAAAEGAAAFARADELLAEVATPAGVPSPAGEDDRGASGGTVGAALDARAPIRLVDASLTYPGRSRQGLAPVTHDFPSTGFVAITGPSGCGKSTLLALLTGERRPSTGQVLVGDVSLDDADLTDWRRAVAWAPQQPWLSEATIAQNVLLGRPEADRAQVREALSRVDLLDAVEALPDGLDTALGEDGAGLSAGQRARLSLARVIVADRPVVLLDEPSAHLDAESESVLLRTLQDLSRTRLVVAVAHRAALVDAADHELRLTAPTSSVAAAASAAVAGPGDIVEVKLSDRDTTARPLDEPRDLPGRLGVRTGALLGTFSVASGVALTATAAWLITRASEHPPVLYLMVAIVGVRLFGLGRPVLRWAERIVSHDAALRQLATRRVAVYDTLIPLVPGRIGRSRGDLLTSVVDDVDALVDAELRVRQPIWTALSVGALGAVIAGAFTPIAGLVVAGLTLACLLVFTLVRRSAGRAEDEFVAARAALTSAVERHVHSLRDLLAWQADGASLRRVHDAAARLDSATAVSVRAVSAGHGAIMLFGAGAVGLTALLVDPATVSPSVLALVTMLPLALVDAFSPLADAAALQVRTRAARARLDELAELAPAVSEPDSPESLPESLAGSAAAALTFEDVSAGWGERPAFTGLSLDLAPGRRAGLVGPSGSGKSTVAALALRFLDPTAGRVTLADIDLTSVSGDEVRRHVGQIDDDPYLFASSVLENVRLARPEATDEEVASALARAHLGTWVNALPHGADTFIGEGHAHVSGGERARLAIARALLADPAVLVLDEPTAHLDADTARLIADELLAAPHTTMLWITHGTVGLDRMDEVVTLGA